MYFTNCCQLSSFIFIINIILGIYCNYYLYSFLFFILLITSLIHHSNYTDFTYILDKTLCFYIVLYGTLLFYQKGIEHFKSIEMNNNTHTYNNIVINFLFNFKTILFVSIIILFLTVIYLYYYGYYYKKYVFDSDITTSFKSHSFIHYISAFAHSLIMLI